MVKPLFHIYYSTRYGGHLYDRRRRPRSNVIKWCGYGFSDYIRRHGYGKDCVDDYLRYNGIDPRVEGKGFGDDMKEFLRDAKTGMKHLAGDVLVEGSELIRNPRNYLETKQLQLSNYLRSRGEQLKHAHGIRPRAIYNRNFHYFPYK